MTPLQFQQEVLPLKHQLYRFAKSYLGQEAEAKDVVQDVLLKAWEQLQGGLDIRNLEAWCMRATRNRALDLKKRKGRQYLPIAEQVDLQSRGADPQRLTEGKQAIEALQQLMSTLPPNQRSVLQLRDVEGYSYQEIADTMELELSNVKVLLHRARKRVQLHLRQFQPHEQA